MYIKRKLIFNLTQFNNQERIIVTLNSDENAVSSHTIMSYVT